MFDQVFDGVVILCFDENPRMDATVMLVYCEKRGKKEFAIEEIYIILNVIIYKIIVIVL